MDEFLKQYSQFSPIEDKETLTRLATTYKPFWEVANGKTLCYVCHGKTYKRGKIEGVSGNAKGNSQVVNNTMPLEKTSLYAGNSGECLGTDNSNNPKAADNQQATCENRESSETTREESEIKTKI